MSSYTVVKGIQGPPGGQGVTGPNGVTGVTGAQGIQGATGVQGIQGPTGPDGIQGIQGIQGVTGATGPQGAVGAGLKIEYFVSLAELQSAGGTNLTTVYIGGIIPANGCVYAAEIQIGVAFDGPGLATAEATVEGLGDAVGSLVEVVDMLGTPGKYAPMGNNPYFSRTAQEIVSTVTLTGCNLDQLTAGNFTVRYLYTVAA